jgi:hypothetical protein
MVAGFEFVLDIQLALAYNVAEYVALLRHTWAGCIVLLS